jgi:hypothetical protein
MNTGINRMFDLVARSPLRIFFTPASRKALLALTRAE